MKNIIKFSIAILGLAGLFACNESHEPLKGGKNITQMVSLYNVQGASVSMANMFKPIDMSVQDIKPHMFIQKFQVGLQFPEKVGCKAIVKVSPEVAKSYMQEVNDTYQLLPDSLIQMPDSVVIAQGTMMSDPVEVKIKVNDALKINTPYLFAIRLEGLDSGNGTVDNSCNDDNTGANSIVSGLNNTLIYTVVRTIGQVKINKVVHLYRTNYFSLEKDFPSNLPNGMTMECFINVKQFRSAADPGEAGISTLCGIEGSCLFRFGDAGVPPNHLQCSGQELNFDFATNKWYHIAVTIADDGTMIVYVNGQKKMEVHDKDAILNGGNPWFIGRSWSSGRGINAQFAEFRIWNKVLTKSQIVDGMYNIDPKTDGLLAYWKMNAADGTKVMDATGNGYNLLLKQQLPSTSTPDGLHKADNAVVIDNLNQPIDLDQ